MTNHSKISIIITAAGSSSRIGTGIKKEFLPYKNGTILSACTKAFLKIINNSIKITDFIITCPIGMENQTYQKIICDDEVSELLILNKINLQIIPGGNSRQKSIFNALCKINENNKNPEFVLIHDGARPFIKETIILDLINATKEFGAAVPAITPIDTQKEIDQNGFIVRHLVRKNLCSVQTPQCFIFKQLFDANLKVQNIDYDFTDDTEIWGYFGNKVKTIKGDVENIKITYPTDLEKLKD